MRYENKTYIGKFGERIYVEYHNPDTNETYTNAEYYVLDLKNEDLNQKLESVGGFCANIMHRICKERNINNINKIMFICTPKETNQFAFLIIYLDSNDEVRLTLNGDNYFDWKYFKNKFEEAVIESGFIYELEDSKYFENIKNSFVNKSSTNFGININGHEFKYGDILLLSDISALNLQDSLKTPLKLLNSKMAILRFYNNSLTGTNIEFCFIDGNNNPICQQQIQNPTINYDQYAENLLQKIKSNGIIRSEDINDIFNFELIDDLQMKWFKFINIRSLIKLSKDGLLIILNKNDYESYIKRNFEAYSYLLKN